MKKLLARKDAKIKRLEDKIAKQVNPFKKRTSPDGVFSKFFGPN